MPKRQFSEFSVEQAQIVNDLAGDFRRVSPVGQTRIRTANVPIIFKDHSDEELVGKGFLPVIVRYSRQGDEVWFRVLYLDVP